MAKINWKGLWKEGDLRVIDARCLPYIRSQWEQGDIIGVLTFLELYEQDCLSFVFYNFHLLKKVGKYEEALLYAYTSGESNHSMRNVDHLKILFDMADADVLRRIGDPIPKQESFTLYRGVCGSGRKRRINGISWTASPNTAALFAMRYAKELNLPDPAVYTVTVPNESIMACYADRGERQYLLRLPLPVKPKRLKEMPEAFLPSDKKPAKTPAPKKGKVLHHRVGQIFTRPDGTTYYVPDKTTS